MATSIAYRPGGSELATVRRTLGALEERFVVAVWDQPGAGKSFAAIDHDELSLLRRADSALYQAKQTGRDRLCVVSTDGTPTR